MAAFSFFSHFLADLCICLDVMRRLTSSSSSDTLFPIVLGFAWIGVVGGLCSRVRCFSKECCYRIKKYKCGIDARSFTWTSLRRCWPCLTCCSVSEPWYCSWTDREQVLRPSRVGSVLPCFDCFRSSSVPLTPVSKNSLAQSRKTYEQEKIPREINRGCGFSLLTRREKISQENRSPSTTGSISS